MGSEEKLRKDWTKKKYIHQYRPLKLHITRRCAPDQARLDCQITDRQTVKSKINSKNSNLTLL